MVSVIDMFSSLPVGHKHPATSAITTKLSKIVLLYKAPNKCSTRLPERTV